MKMNYLQVMPTDEVFFDSNIGFIIIVSIVLLGVIVLFDRSKALLNWVSKKRT